MVFIYGIESLPVLFTVRSYAHFIIDSVIESSFTHEVMYFISAAVNARSMPNILLHLFCTFKSFAARFISSVAALMVVIPSSFQRRATFSIYAKLVFSIFTQYYISTITMALLILYQSIRL